MLIYFILISIVPIYIFNEDKKKGNVEGSLLDPERRLVLL